MLEWIEMLERSTLAHTLRGDGLMEEKCILDIEILTKERLWILGHKGPKWIKKVMEE